MNHFYIIGMNDNRTPSFSPEVRQVIAGHTLFSGGLRHHEIVAPFLPEGAVWIDIKAPLDPLFDRYRSYEGRESIVVFASGDPLFFGFANTIRKRMPDARIELFPAFNSLQTLAHRLLMPYHDMRIVSLTGRPWHEFDRALIEETPKLGVLTDREHTPAAIARRMLDYGYAGYALYVGEHLGHPEEERIRPFDLETAADQNFSTPNCVLLIKTAETGRRLFGLPDQAFEHLDRREKMITKMPIRLLSLSMLDLRNRKRFWDIGFCTGSVSIEAKLQFPHLHITAFEIREEGEKLMAVNARRFGAPGIETVIGDFCTADLSGRDAPEAVFIGGHGGKLPEILTRIAGILPPGGTVVFNSVSEESRSLFLEAVRHNDLVAQEEARITLNDFNTITVLKAVRCS